MTPTKLTPRPDQEEHIARILAEPTKAAIIGSQVGFGKTLVTAEVVIRAGWQRVLYIIIGKTFNQWRDRLAAQSDGAIQLRRMESNEKGLAAYEDFLAGKPGHYAATLNWLHQRDVEFQDKTDLHGNVIYKVDKKTGQPTDKPERQSVRLGTFKKMSARKGGRLDAIIHDESHGAAARDSAMRRTLLTIDSEWKIALSATSFGNLLASHGWATPKWCWPDRVPAYWSWIETYFRQVPKLGPTGKPVYVNGRLMTEPVEIEPGAWVSSLPLYIRGENPEQAPEALEVYVDPTPEQARQYAEFEEDLMAWLRNWDGDHEPLVIDVPAVKRIRLRQVALAELSFDEKGEVTFAPDAPSSKLQALKGILDHWGDQPVILMTDSRKFAKLTAERMTAAGYRAEAWVGGMSDREAERIKREYLDGDLKYIVLGVQAGGTGLDFMQLRSSKIVWLSVPDGNPTLEEQAVGRVFRNGMTTEYGPFQQVRILTRGTLDTEVLESLLRKGMAMRNSMRVA